MIAKEMTMAISSAQALIERHVSTAFSQLNAATGCVEVRKRLHAAFVQAVIREAKGHFHDNMALSELLKQDLQRV